MLATPIKVEAPPGTLVTRNITVEGEVYVILTLRLEIEEWCTENLSTDVNVSCEGKVWNLVFWDEKDFIFFKLRWW